MNAKSLISIYVLLGEVCAPSPVQAYSAIASGSPLELLTAKLLLSLPRRREPRANLCYTRLTYVMDLVLLHIILLLQLQLLLLQPAIEVRRV